MLVNILISIFLVRLLTNSTPDYEKTFLIENNIQPYHIYWISPDSILISERESFTFNLLSRERENIETCDDCIVGYDNEILYCEYKNKEIQSLEEFSTNILVKDMDNHILKDINIFPTVKPIICKKEYIVAITSYTFLEQKVYLIKGDQYEEITLDGDRYTENNKYKILLDDYKNLWVYRKNTK